MSNGQVCCLRRICCPPLEVAKKWKIKLSSWISTLQGASVDMIASELSTKLLAEHDPAPLGTAAAVFANWNKSDAELGGAIRIVYQSTMDEAATHVH
jgi:hypothetical protein